MKKCILIFLKHELQSYVLQIFAIWKLLQLLQLLVIIIIFREIQFFCSSPDRWLRSTFNMETEAVQVWRPTRGAQLFNLPATLSAQPAGSNRVQQGALNQLFKAIEGIYDWQLSDVNLIG